jgi:hypothetical protein
MEVNSMASEASLAGIQTFGLRWKAEVKLNVPDIPAALSECDTYFDRIKFAHNLVIYIVKRLNKVRDKKLPSSALYRLDEILEQLKDSFFFDDIEAVKNWEEADLIDINEYLEDELLGQLGDLYDWADYYRVCFV